MAAILDDHQMRHREHEAEMVLLLLGAQGAGRLPEADRQGRATRQPARSAAVRAEGQSEISTSAMSQAAVTARP